MSTFDGRGPNTGPQPNRGGNLNVEQRVREFIVEYFYVADPGRLGDDDSLIDSGVVDSTGMMGVILFIESEFAIHVGDDETTPDNLDSVRRIAAYVERKVLASADGQHDG